MYLFKYDPALGSASLGRILDLLSKNKSPSLYSILSHLVFSLQLHFSILFCFFRVIGAQSALNWIGKIISHPYTNYAGAALNIVCTGVLLVANAVTGRYSSRGLSSSKSASSRLKVLKQLPSTW